MGYIKDDKIKPVWQEREDEAETKKWEEEIEEGEEAEDEEETNDWEEEKES